MRTKLALERFCHYLLRTQPCVGLDADSDTATVLVAMDVTTNV